MIWLTLLWVNLTYLYNPNLQTERTMKNNQQQQIKLSKLDWIYIMIMIGVTILYAYVDGQSIIV